MSINTSSPTKNKLQKLYIWIAASAIGLSGYAHAGADAGQLLQQVEKQHTVQPLKQSESFIVAPEPIQPLSEGQSVTVKSYSFSGNTLVEDEQLSTVLANYVGRELSFSELQFAASEIAAYYREAGWIVRAYLPQQDITDGDIKIHIIEAIFGGASIKDLGSERVAHQQLLDITDYALHAGSALNVYQLDRALFLMDDLPGINVSGSLKKGHGENETDLILLVTDEPFFIGDIQFSNTGTRSTGQEQLVGNFNINSPLKTGDQATINITHSEGNDYGRLAYSMPLGTDGWRLGVSGSYLQYELIHDDFSGLDAQGSSYSMGIEAKYPIVRSRKLNVFVGINLDHKKFDNEAVQATTTRYAVDSVTLSLNGNLYDTVYGGGANGLGIKAIRGRIDLDTVDTGLNGDFTKVNYAFNRQQFVTNTISLYGSISGQVTDSNLDSSEKMYLGGPYGVRAYPMNEAGGDTGQLVNIELRKHLPYRLYLAGFYDYGHVKVNHNNVNNVALNNLSLNGMGASLAWLSLYGLNLQLTWAHRLGNNPNPTTAGKDQDGSYHPNRYWLQASMQF